MKEIKPKAQFLIEISNEVVNGLGGVYTVLATKSSEMKRYYGENYYAIGPYYKRSAQIEFEERTPPSEIKRIFEGLQKEKIICHYGYWLIEGKPKTILVDFSGRLKELKKIKDIMIKSYGVDCKTGGSKLKQWDISSSKVDPTDINLKLIWGNSASKLVKKLLQSKNFKNKRGILQFHFADPSFSLIADLKKENAKVGLVATAHSTRLGRAIAYNKEDLNKEIKEGLKKGRRVSRKREYRYGGYNLVNHHLELLGAKYAHVLTAVSEVTGKEMKYILGRQPDVITPNGLDMERFPSLDERAILHHESKEKIYRFLNAYFLPHYSVDVPHSLLFFTSGRYELTTKGYDLLFEALARLNRILKKENYQNNIFVFLFIMTSAKDSNEEILQNLAVYDVIEHAVKEELPHLEKRVIASLVHGREIKKEILFDEHFLIESKKLMLRFKKKKFEDPPVSAFKGLKKEDIIMKFLLKCGLDNKEDDKVKVIFYPAPVSVADGLLSMEYNEVIRGMHLGIFPSIYEPWGYTPLETAAQAVMSITSDVSGFGKFILKNSDQRKKPGILVLRTENKKRERIINELVDMMYWVSKLPRKKRIEKKLEAKKLSALADWKEFAKYYIRAHNLAIERLNARQSAKKR
jgi:glycogen(starch) synthase